MCGVTGLVLKNLSDRHENKVKSSLELIEKRGPDAQGFEKVSFECGFDALIGHSRLRIIDLSKSADQPLFYKNYVLVFNGELYNFKHLRKELKELGYQFDTQSDSEVVLKSLVHWGEDALEKFDGMWAIVLCDTSQNTVLISRDHFGEKPLYYSFARDGFSFASTADALAELMDHKKVDQDYVSEYLSSGYVTSHRTIWSGGSKLSAGQAIKFDLEQGTSEVVKNLSHRVFDVDEGTREFCIEEFEALLVESLSRRLIADVPINFLLSGGIDSSYITVLAKQELGADIEAITISDEIGSSTETKRAVELCQNLGVAHKFIQTRTKEVDNIYSVALKAMDEPVSDPAFPMLIELISNVPADVRVLMTGDGADEMFLSYSNYRSIIQSKTKGLISYSEFWAYISKRLSDYPAAIKKILREVFNNIVKSNAKEKLMFNLNLASADYLIENIKRHLAISKNYELDALYIHAYFNDLAEYLLVKADRGSMFHSKESRTPYLSWDLQKYVKECTPQSLKQGSKEHIVARLQKRLGINTPFEKRGFFASGQKILPKLNAGQDVHPMIAQWVAKNSYKSQQYRVKVMNDWLNINYV